MKETVEQAAESDYSKDVLGYEGIYTVNKNGDVFSIKRNRFLNPSINKDGYSCVSLSKNGKSKQHRVHRIVAESFLENPENKRTVNHINLNKQDNSLINLEWATDFENINHAIQNGICFHIKNGVHNCTKVTGTMLLYAIELRKVKNFNYYQIQKVIKEVFKVSISRQSINNIISKIDKIYSLT